MITPKPAAVLAAISDIKNGMMWREAATKHQVQQSSIKRALDRIASQCPCCGQPVKAVRQSAQGYPVNLPRQSATSI